MGLGGSWGRGCKGKGRRAHPYHRELWVEERPVLSFTHREAEDTKDKSNTDGVQDYIVDPITYLGLSF